MNTNDIIFWLINDLKDYGSIKGNVGIIARLDEIETEVLKMNKKKNDLISKKRILYELGESTMPKQYRDFCIRVINDINLTPVVMASPSEDLRDWIVDYWFNVEDNINFSILTYLQNNEFDPKDYVDRDNLGAFISEMIQTGILNVIDTYEEEV